MNYLPDVSTYCHFILFADDTTDLFHDKNVNQFDFEIETELKYIVDWLTNNRLALN